MFSMLKQLHSLLSPKERKQVVWCFSLMLAMAVFDVVGVASIMPFMAVISDPDAIHHHAKLAMIYHHLPFKEPHQFLIFLGLLVFFLLLIGNAIATLSTWTTLRFTYMREASLSKHLFKHYLGRPYAFFLNRNASELSKNTLHEVYLVINNAFIPIMLLMAKSAVALLILSLLLYMDPVLAATVLFVLGGSYVAIYFKIRHKLAAIGRDSVEHNRIKHGVVIESLCGIKEVKLVGKENYFYNVFSDHAVQQASNNTLYNVLSQLPRYLLETIAFGGVLIIVVYLLIMKRDINNVMPLLALYAFASFRLMPAINQIFSSMTALKVSRHALDLICKDLKVADNTPAQPIKAIPFQDRLQLKNVSFRYQTDARLILKNVSLEIKANSTIGIAGKTGSGKTTMVDILMGLLIPEAGALIIDGKELPKTDYNSWQRKIGYVTQSTYLFDDTILKNIAIGMDESEIDLEAAIEAAKCADIYDFILHECPEQFATQIGDRGIRLSGGQKQRIAIARALYHNPEILVLDEATSALDVVTEDNILQAMRKLARKKTIIIIAHRLSTLQECDNIYLIEGGEIVASGSYQDLSHSNAHFKNMTVLAALDRHQVKEGKHA